MRKLLARQTESPTFIIARALRLRRERSQRFASPYGFDTPSASLRATSNCLLVQDDIPLPYGCKCVQSAKRTRRHQGTALQSCGRAPWCTPLTPEGISHRNTIYHICKANISLARMGKYHALLARHIPPPYGTYAVPQVCNANFQDALHPYSHHKGRLTTKRISLRAMLAFLLFPLIPPRMRGEGFSTLPRA